MNCATGLLIGGSLLALSACQATPVCPPRPEAVEGTAVPAASEMTDGRPGEVQLGSRRVAVDRIVTGVLCDDRWAGTVYVGCEVEVRPWEGEPTFLQGCDLEIAPGSVVYVAHHNNAAYHNGCSCHTGDTAGW